MVLELHAIKEEVVQMQIIVGDWGLRTQMVAVVLVGEEMALLKMQE